MTQFDESKETSGNKSASEAVNEAVNAVPVNDGTAANAVEAATAANETVAAQSSSAQPQPAQPSASQPVQPQEMSAQQLAFGNPAAVNFTQPVTTASPVTAQPMPAQPAQAIQPAQAQQSSAGQFCDQPGQSQPANGYPAAGNPPYVPSAGQPSNGENPEGKPGFCKRFKWFFILLITLVYSGRIVLLMPSREKMMTLVKNDDKSQSMSDTEISQASNMVFWIIVGVVAVFFFIFALLITFRCCSYEKKRQYEASLAGEDVYFSKAILLTISLLGTCFLIAAVFKLTGGVLLISKAIIVAAVVALLFKIGEPEKPWHRWVILAVALYLTYTFDATPVNLFENV